MVFIVTLFLNIIVCKNQPSTSLQNFKRAVSNFLNYFSAQAQQMKGEAKLVYNYTIRAYSLPLKSVLSFGMRALDVQLKMRRKMNSLK